MAQRVAVYPGTFDPPTNGHLDIVQRAASSPRVCPSPSRPTTIPAPRRFVGMPSAIALAAVLCGLTPQEAIVAGTVSAAHALGRGERCGALVEGRRADIVALETDDERDLAYRLGASLVREVFAAGRQVAGWSDA